MKNKSHDDNKEINFDRFEKMINKNKKKNNVDFEKMSPYEIINYLREQDVKKNYKVLPSNRFFRKMIFSSIFAMFVLFIYTTTGSGDIIQRNIDVFVNKTSENTTNSLVSDYVVDLIIQGDFKTLIELYRDNVSNSIDNHFELVTLLGGINNSFQAQEELLIVKNKIEQSSVGKVADEYKHNVYKLIDSFLIFGNLDEAKGILDRYRQTLESDILFLEREILYLLLSGNESEATNMYFSIVLDDIENIDSILSYARLSVNFNQIERVVQALDKVLSKDINNIDVLSVIDMVSSYNINELNNVLNFNIDQFGENERLRLIRARANRYDLSRTQINIEDIDEVIKKHLNQNLPKIVKLDILTNALREDDSLILFNELRSIEDKTFDIYYALAKYSLDLNNFNDALNFLKQSINLNKNFSENYNILLNIMVNQNRYSNIHYFYLKSKISNLTNTSTDKNFAFGYVDSFNDVDKAIEILEFAKKISIFESDLRYYMSDIYIDQRMYNEARNELYRAIELKPNSIYFRTLGVLLIELGEVEDGISNIRIAYSIDSEDILNLNNAAAYYANVERDIQRAFSNIRAAYENLNTTYNEYTSLIIRENYFKLETLYNSEEVNEENIPFIAYLY